MLFGRPPRPRRAFVCPLDIVGLIGVRGSMWTKRPEPHAVIGPSLLLIFLVIRHQVSRGCPSPESETN